MSSAGKSSPQRCVREGVISAAECAELCFVLDALGVDGNRAAVHSATIHDIAHTHPECLLPLVAARERVQETVEQTFGREMELFPEFTALIGWGPGGSIDWHHDANRDYLAQRDYAAVLHLSKSGADFGGGDFCFRDDSIRSGPRTMCTA
eukprot:jgi/Tetstr1/436354/TSEL_025190.t1